MRAIAVTSPGQNPELVELDKPTPGAGAVLLRVQAASLNPMDNALASGVLAEAMEHRYPLVLGRDVVGVVEELGADVVGVSVGDDVIAYIPFEAPFERGTLAEYAVVPASSIALRPADLDIVDAASLPLAGGGALAAIDAADIKPGQVVLVNGASGAVGRFAVQLLTQRGAVVVATASSSTARRVRELGAAEVVDYAEGDVSTQVRTRYPHGVDALVNLFGSTNDDVPLGAVKSGGRVSTIVSVPDEAAASAAGLNGGGIIIANPDTEIIGRLAQGAASGALKTDVSRVVPLDEAVEALATVASGAARGKIVVTVD